MLPGRAFSPFLSKQKTKPNQKTKTMRGCDPYFSTQNREREREKAKKNVKNKRKEKMEKEGDYSPDGYGIWSRPTKKNQ